MIPLSWIGDGARDGPVAVEADDGEVEDGRRAEQYVGGQPQLAQRLAERPVTHQLVDKRQRHDEQSHEKVADSQRRDEVVLDATQTTTVARDRGHHQRVADDDQQHDGGDDDPVSGINDEVSMVQFLAVFTQDEEALLITDNPVFDFDAPDLHRSISTVFCALSSRPNIDQSLLSIFGVP